MASNHNITGLNIDGDVHAHAIGVFQIINNIIKPPVPLPKNIRFKVEKPIQTFTGRETFLEELHKVVKEGQDGGEGGVTVLTQEPLSVVAATGGIGKTETVRRYIQLHEHEYDHIIWIDAEDASYAKSQFSQLAMRLKISTDFEGKPKEFDLILTEIFEELLQNAHLILLVFDNAESLEDDPELNLSGIKSLRPKSLSPFFVEPKIIVTSRNQNWSLHKVIQLGLWTELEVVFFVIGRLKLEKNSENESMALQLGTLFGRLPIALQSAVAVILQQSKRRKPYGIQNLIDEYDSGSRKVLAAKPLEANMRPTQTSIPMLVLWNISLEKIVGFEEGALAIKILCFMAYMSSTRIPEDFLCVLFQNCTTEDSFDIALEILEDYSLIAPLTSEDSNSRNFSIHRMIQDSTIENLRTNDGQEQRLHLIFNEATFLNETQVLLQLSAESKNYIQALTGISRSGELVENLTHIANHVSSKLHRKEFRQLTEGVASVLRSTNNFTKSIELYEKALKAMSGAMSGVESEILDKILLKRKLAGVYGESGNVEKSIELYLQVEKEEARALGPNHADTLGTRSNIANGLHLQGNFHGAMTKYREVLQGYQNSGDNQSIAFLSTKSNFACLLSNQGQTKEAFKLLTEVLTEQQQEDPHSNSKEVIATKSNLASVLEIEGNLEESSKIMEQTILDATRAHGPFHFLTLKFKRKYAKLLHGQSKFDLAAPILLELLEIEEADLGPSHPSTLTTKNNLAALYIQTREFSKALPLLDVELRERVFGLEHPETMTTANNLAFVMENQGRFGKALLLHKKICKIRKQVKGLNHPDTLATMYNIGHLYYKMDEFDKATKVAQDVLLRREEVLGKDHPVSMMTLKMLTECRRLLLKQHDMIEKFTMLTCVSAETGHNLLQASNWILEAALDTFFNSTTSKDITYLEEEDEPLIPTRTTSNAQNKQVDVISRNTIESEINEIQDLKVQEESVVYPNKETTTSISFRLADSKRLRGQFGISSTVKDLYEFVNENCPYSRESNNYVLIFYPNVQLINMGQTLEEANLLNAAITQKLLQN